MALDFFQLNPAQRDAALHIDGPLLILAGAGTGKTRVLTHRIIHLIESKKATPEEILALTFTEKATSEIQERLDVLLPYGYQELCVSTFHAFCDRILREKGLSIGLDTDYQLLSQSDLALFLKERLFTFDLDFYRPLGNPNRFLLALVQYFGHLRDELIDPQIYLKAAHELLKSSTTDADRENAHRQLELANAYAHYAKLLIDESRLDFASLHFFALQLLENSSEHRDFYENRFRYILVDEFQDTNTAQNRLVELLAQNHRNIMVVGDDDQCIYKWRGASLSNISQFKDRFPDTKQIVLTENYRSSQSILDMSYAVIQNNNPFRLEAKDAIDKRLRSVNHLSGYKPKITFFTHYLNEVAFVSETIQKQVSSQESRYSDFAILVRAASHAEPFIDDLKTKNIPYHFSGTVGLFQQEVIKDLLATLRAISNSFDDISLFRFLSLPTFQFEMNILLDLLQEAKSTSSSLYTVLKNRAATPTLFKLGEGPFNLGMIFELLSDLRNLSRTNSASHILGFFLKRSGYIKHLEVLSRQGNSEGIESVAEFSQLIKSFEETHSHPDLISTLVYLDARFDLGDGPQPTPPSLDMNAVNILTIHAAKGLEFETVFVVNLVQNRFPTIHRGSVFEVPDSLLKESLQDSSHLAEERRLFYVAATRAKSHLYLTASEDYGGRKRWKPSIFIEETKASGMTEFVKAESKIPIILSASDSLEEKPIHFQYERQHRSLRLSFSRIDVFQTCPLKYKFKYVYQLSESLSHAASFGSSVHNVLNDFYSRLKQGETPSLELLKSLYEHHWISRGYESRAHMNARHKKGWEMLCTFYELNSNPWLIPKYLERPFTLKLSSGLTVSGRIDRIDQHPNGSVEVIDYKTGALKTQKDVDRDLQLSIYALACRDIFNLTVDRLSLYYLGDQQKIVTTRSSEQLEATLEELNQIAATIHTSSFEATPSSYICSSCDYRLLCDRAAF